MANYRVIRILSRANFIIHLKLIHTRARKLCRSMHNVHMRVSVSAVHHLQNDDRFSFIIISNLNASRAYFNFNIH